MVHGEKQEAITAKTQIQLAIDHTTEATYVSVWDGLEIRTTCQWNPKRQIAYDIQMVEVSGVQVLEREYVELYDGTKIPVDSSLETEEGIPAATSLL